MPVEETYSRKLMPHCSSRSQEEQRKDSNQWNAICSGIASLQYSFQVQGMPMQPLNSEGICLIDEHRPLSLSFVFRYSDLCTMEVAILLAEFSSLIRRRTNAQISPYLIFFV